MRILVLSELYPPYHKGGHEIRFKVLADGLSERGHDVFILTSRYGVNSKKVNGNIFRLLHYFEVGNTRGLRRRYQHIKSALSGRLNYFITKKTIKDLKPDIVYAGQVAQTSIYPLKASKKLGIPIVHHVGNYDFPELVESCISEGNPLKRFYRKLILGFRSLDELDLRYIITVSEAVKKKYVEVGFPERNISAIHARGAFLESIADKNRAFSMVGTGPIRLLYVGRIVREKGVHIAIEAVHYLAAYMRANELVIDMIGEGDGDYLGYLYNLIKSLKIADYVRFKKTMPHKELLSEYGKHEILLFPSIWEEPFSGVLIEAMSQGLPIVATNTGGTPELITHEWNGLLVRPNDSKEMAEAVYKLIQNPSLARKIANNGIDLISKRYNIKDITTRIENYLMDVVLKERYLKSFEPDIS
jgi:glycosyltransferase involved in cell wall biosynthesis